MENEKPYMVEQIIKYSDNTQTVIRYKKDATVELEDLEPQPQAPETSEEKVSEENE